MTRDAFGNPTPGIPPSISDTFHDIARYRSAPLSLRLEYHYARVDAMIGRDPSPAWALWARLQPFSASQGAK